MIDKSLKVGTAFTWVKGKKPSRLYEVVQNNTIPYLSASYLRTHKPDYYVDVSDKNCVFANKEDIILLWDGSKAGDVFYGLSGAISSTMVKFSSSEFCSNMFLFYLLKYNVNLLSSQTTGSTIPHVNGAVLKDIDIFITKISEQEKIVNFLSTVELAINAQEELLCKLRELKQSMVHRLFTRGIKEEQVKLTEIGEIPESWKVVEFGSLCESIVGGGTPSTKVDSYWNGSHPWITTKWLGANLYLKTGEKMITEEAIKKSATHIIPANGLLFATRVGVGKVGVNLVPLAINQDLAGIILYPENDVLFFAYQLLGDRVQRHIKSLKRGATIQGITREDLKKILVCVPSAEEQKKIASAISSIDKKMALLEEKNSKNKDLFKTLLHEFMSGERRV